jgi:hypothetical protein
MTPSRIAINRLLSMHGVTTEVNIEEQDEDMLLMTLSKNVHAVFVDGEGALCIDFEDYE